MIITYQYPIELPSFIKTKTIHLLDYMLDINKNLYPNKNRNNYEKTLFFISENNTASSPDIQKYLDISISYASNLLRELYYRGYVTCRRRNQANTGNNRHQYKIRNLEKEIEKDNINIKNKTSFLDIQKDFDIDINQIPQEIKKIYRGTELESPLHKILKIYSAQKFYEQGYKIEFESTRLMGKTDVLAVKKYDIHLIECETFSNDLPYILTRLFSKARYNKIIITVPKTIEILTDKETKSRYNHFNQILKDYNFGLIACPYFSKPKKHKKTIFFSFKK